jgi:Conjugative transposon protein TcpC
MARDPAPVVTSGMSRWLDRFHDWRGRGGAHGVVAGFVTPMGRFRLARAGVWVLLVLIAIAATAGLLTAGSAARLARERPAPTEADSGAAIGPAGWAAQFVTAYLSAGAGDEARLRPFLGSVPEMEGSSDAEWARSTAVVQVRRAGASYWAVTVAADVAAVGPRGSMVELGVWYYRVGVMTGRDGAAYVATGLPAQVTAPAEAAAPTSAYGGDPVSSSDPLSDTVTRFLAAYLCGQGELDRYAAASAGLAPVQPPPFARITVLELTRAAGGGGVLAQVRATDSAGRVRLLTYPLQVAVQGGNWEITRLDPAPLLQGGGA